MTVRINEWLKDLKTGQWVQLETSRSEKEILVYLDGELRYKRDYIHDEDSPAKT